MPILINIHLDYMNKYFVQKLYFLNLNYLLIKLQIEILQMTFNYPNPNRKFL
jgi:hypothetical protein